VDDGLSSAGVGNSKYERATVSPPQPDQPVQSPTWANIDAS
jgi:hypothetical protein